MPYYRKYIYAGPVLEMHEYFAIRPPGIKQRSENKNISPEWQKDMNLRNTKKQIDRLINTNFDKNDYFLTHTYGQGVTAEQAEKELTNYFRRINYRCAKLGLPKIKYIAVTECKSKRIHHHIVLKCALPIETIIDTWGKGRTHIGKLDSSEDYQGLSRYITKDMDIDAPSSKKRYKASRNLDKPIVIKKEVKRFVKDWRPPKGYRYIQYPDYVASDINGLMRYARAVKIGCQDIAGGIRREVQLE
jgi:hypothetical protein